MTIRYRRPHRIKRKKPIFHHRFFWPVVLILIIGTAFSYFLFFSQFFQIQKIIISGNKKVPEKGIREVVERELAGKRLLLAANNLFLVRADKIRKDILSQFPQIAEIEMGRSFPNGLNITLVERREVAIVCEKECFLLDSQGVIFEKIPTGDYGLPEIQNPNLDKLELGVEIIKRDLLAKILRILSGLDDIGILTKKANIISEERINVITLEGWEICFDPQKDLDWQLTKLKAVLEKYIPQEKRELLEYIELRFGNLAPFKYREEAGE